MNLLKIISIIAILESGENDRAFNEKELAHGRLQIRDCVLQDVNNEYKTSYNKNDCYNKIGSTVIFILYVRKWGCETEEQVVRTWNGGPRGPKKESTLKYWKKYLKIKEKIK